METTVSILTGQKAKLSRHKQKWKENLWPIVLLFMTKETTENNDQTLEQKGSTENKGTHNKNLYQNL